MKIRTLAAMLILGLTASACQQQASQTTTSTTATLVWTGEIAADGCGFEVLIDGKSYLPENEEAIPAKFKESDSTEVSIAYEMLPEPIDRRCGMIPEPRVKDAIRILSVEAKE